MKKIYLATPYTGTPAQQKKRFMQACLLAGNITKQGHSVFSPIAHSHPISQHCDLPGDHTFWKTLNESWLEWADEIWVGQLSGWKESKGVQWEIMLAMQNGKKIQFIGMNDCP